MRRAIALIGLGAAVIAASGILTLRGSLPASHPTAAYWLRPAAPATALAASSRKPRSVPKTLVIPSIGVTASIEPVGVDGNGDMAVPVQPQDVAWYAPGPWPGQPGDAVIAGHLDWYADPATESGGTVPAVFAKLRTLARSASVEIVSADGTRQTWTVTDTEFVAYNSHPARLFKRSGAPMLSLVTCAGSWSSTAATYTQRLVVDATPA